MTEDDTGDAFDAPTVLTAVNVNVYDPFGTAVKVVDVAVEIKPDCVVNVP